MGWFKDFGSAIIGGGAQLLGNLLGFGSNQSTNNKNYQIAQMNNEWSERMLDKQLAYNTEMFGQQTAYDWKKMNAQNAFTQKMWQTQADYNSAAAQRQRLEAAGLNPYLMMNGGSAGTAGTANSSGSGGSPSAGSAGLPSPSQVQMRPYDFDFSSVGGIIQTLMDVQAQKDVRSAQAKQINIENSYLASEAAARIQNIKADTFFKRSSENLNAMNYARMQAMFSSDVERSQREAENAKYTGMLIQAQATYQLLQSKLSTKELQYFDQNQYQKLAIGAAQQYALVKQGMLSEAEAKRAVANQLESEARTRGIKLDNHVKSGISNALIGSARQSYRQQYWEAEDTKNKAKWYDSYGKYMDSFGSLLNTVGTFGLGAAFGGIGSKISKYKAKHPKFTITNK